MTNQKLWTSEEEPKMTAMSQPMQVLTSQESVEWYTPSEYVEMVREVLGDIDLDPASSETPQQWIRAKTYWTAGDDGLSRRWFGRVFLNPPYPAAEWARYMVKQWRNGALEPSIALVNANLGYAWFEELWTRYPVCFVKERIFFVGQDGKGGQSKKASAFLYFGDAPFKFNHTFKSIGRVIMPDAGSSRAENGLFR